MSPGRTAHGEMGSWAWRKTDCTCLAGYKVKESAQTPNIWTTDPDPTPRSYALGIVRLTCAFPDWTHIKINIRTVNILQS
ncbi:hypothetical protein JZ751_003113 [Albula glossodonta]|uniref:Uncharacterized protein n=1 Tax=Albula glossodonta TaxID=121402 RepID=A0A8T2N8T1_9TELE|nr:hypothetical protein JZ751_003113 [Albula glossodonta]